MIYLKSKQKNKKLWAASLSEPFYILKKKKKKKSHVAT